MNGLEQYFLKTVDMGMGAAFVVLAVLLCRLILKRAPKKYSYLLWMIAGVRFLLPVTIPGIISLVPFKSNAVTYGKLAYMPAVDTGLNKVDAVVNKVLANVAPPSTYMSINPMQVYIALGAFLWAGIGLGILIYGLVNYGLLKSRLMTATLLQVPDVYETDRVDAPVLAGFLKPRIYLPLDMPQEEARYVIAHEQAHKRRGDHIVKLLAFAVVVLHWYNPFAWVFFLLLVKDMEMSCDEKVMRSMPDDIRAEYSGALLALAMRQSGGLSFSPLAFGENNTKARVKNVLRYKKPMLWVGVTCVIIIVGAACLLLTGHEDSGDGSRSADGAGGAAENGETQAEAFVDYGNREGISGLTENEWVKELCDGRNLYVGNASADGKLLELLTRMYPVEMQRTGMMLQTTDEPYGITDTCAGRIPEGTDPRPVMYKSGSILLATISNIGSASLEWKGENEESITVEVKREELEQALGIDGLYAMSESPEQLKEYMDAVEGLLRDMVFE